MEKFMTYFEIEMVNDTKLKWLKLIKVLFSTDNRNALLLLRLFQISSNKKGFVNLVLKSITRKKLIKNYGIELSSKTEIELGFNIGHANGIIIGEGVKIGKNVTIYQQVTIGLSSMNEKGQYDKYPVIGDNCIIYSGAKIFGDIQLGQGTVVGANSVLTTDTEPNSVYAGVPARRIK